VQELANPKGLSFLLKLGHHAAMQHKDSNDNDLSPADAIRIAMMKAIAGKLLVTATYNGRDMTLAPHALFLRRGEMFVSALNLDKKWRSDESPRLGHFKLAGLTNPSVSSEHFDAIPDFEEAVPQVEDELVLAVA
jgi:hypothetical protein